MMARYAWAGGSEFMLHVAPERRVQIILVQPLFDEANRLRKTLADVMRGLDAKGFGVMLPDLPATGESLITLHDASFADWQAALGALVNMVQSSGKTVVIASFRGGSLIDTCVECAGIWRLTPETGARVLRDMARAVLARHSGIAPQDAFDKTGYRLPLGLIAALEAARPQPAPKLRCVRLEQDPNDADARIAGTPLWRRSEPGEDAQLTADIIDDLTAWALRCAN